MVEVDVLSRNYKLLKIVLDIGNHAEKFSLVVVVQQGNRPRDFLFMAPLFLYELLAYEVSDRLRPVRVFFPADKPVKFLKQVCRH